MYDSAGDDTSSIGMDSPLMGRAGNGSHGCPSLEAEPEIESLLDDVGH